MSEQLMITVKVTGTNDELADFVGLCKRIQALGDVGASRTLSVDVDGDGSARLKFDFGSTDVSGIELGSIDDWIDQDVIKLGIGN